MANMKFRAKLERMLSRENMSRIVKITGIVFVLSYGFSALREGILAYFVTAVYLTWFVFSILFFAIRKRYIAASLFLAFFSVYLYALFNFSVFVINRK